MKLSRSAGVLFHPTSLPGPDGIGTLGSQARRFVDRLSQAGQSWWQVLPLNAPGHGGSPYSATSAFAGNDLMIDLQPLAECGWLNDDEIEGFRQKVARVGPDRLRYEVVGPAKGELLDRACQRWRADASDRSAHQRAAYQSFATRQTGWLDDYALFMVLKRHHGGVQWRQWSPEYVERDPEALARFRRAHADAIAHLKIRQWWFFSQWQNLREYAAEQGVKFIGDLPIFVAMDSADVWANRDIFQMDAHGHAQEVSGVPPDYFSENGQKWGNPLYDWPTIDEHGYQWWLDRIETVLRTVDLVRIDHFRGLQAYWAVPAEADTAVDGRWRNGPADALFDAIRGACGEVPLIAEDLGIITDDVRRLRDRHHLPGMKVLQFADWNDPDHIFLPPNYDSNFVAYTGTHDNNTTRGWWNALSADRRDAVRRYLSCTDQGVVDAMIAAVFESDAVLAITPLQDILGLGAEARMNHPGGNGDNWRWRVRESTIDSAADWCRIAELTDQSARQQSVQ